MRLPFLVYEVRAPHPERLPKVATTIGEGRLTGDVVLELLQAELLSRLDLNIIQALDDQRGFLKFARK